MWLAHTKSNSGIDRELLDIITDFAEKLFGKFKNFEDKYFKLRYIEYEFGKL